MTITYRKIQQIKTNPEGTKPINSSCSSRSSLKTKKKKSVNPQASEHK